MGAGPEGDGSESRNIIRYTACQFGLLSLFSHSLAGKWHYLISSEVK